jgi:(2Fe-2S) ferredoxin
MKKSHLMPRFRKHLFICNNKRSEDDPRGSCSEKNSDSLIDYAKKRVHELGLKGEIRVNKAGCLDACAYGPAMVVYPDDTWYSPKTKNDIEVILEKHILNNKIAEELVIDFKIK